MVCSQYYSQREWALGDITDGKVFTLRMPLVFQSTTELMKTVHENLSQQTIGIDVVRSTLKWSKVSFVAAKLAGARRVVASSIASACKCGLFHAKSKNKRARKADPRPKSRASEARGGPGPGDDDAGVDSDDSLLDALAKELERGTAEANEIDKTAGDADELEHDTGDSEQLRSLVAAVASSPKYTDSSTKPVAPSVSSTPGPSAPKENLKEVQDLERLLDERNVREAIQKVKSTSSSSSSSKQDAISSHLSQHAQHDVSEYLSGVNSMYGGHIGPEEEAEEGLLTFASFGPCASNNDNNDDTDGDDVGSTVNPKSLPETASNQPLSRDKEIERWAQELAKTSSSFHDFDSGGHFFPEISGFDSSLFRCVSLVQFLDEVEADAGEAGEANETEDGAEEDDDEGTFSNMYAQFVHWDSPEPPRHCGRRLRVEAQRLVWRPPARQLKDDELTSLFSSGSARVILVPWFGQFVFHFSFCSAHGNSRIPQSTSSKSPSHLQLNLLIWKNCGSMCMCPISFMLVIGQADIGVPMLKAKGQHRSKVPDNVWKLHNVFSVILQGAPPEGGRCFVCRRHSTSMCPLCGLWSHEECCEELVHCMVRKLLGDETLSRQDDPNFELEVSNCLAATYMKSSSDSSAEKAVSLLSFDSKSQSSVGSSQCELLLVDSACKLCQLVMCSQTLAKCFEQCKAASSS